MRNRKNFRMMNKTRNYCLDQELAKEVEMIYNSNNLHKNMISNKPSN